MNTTLDKAYHKKYYNVMYQYIAFADASFFDYREIPLLEFCNESIRKKKSSTQSGCKL